MGGAGRGGRGRGVRVDMYWYSAYERINVLHQYLVYTLYACPQTTIVKRKTGCFDCTCTCISCTVCVYYGLLFLSFISSFQIVKYKERISKIVIKFDDVETVPELYYVPIEHV